MVAGTGRVDSPAASRSCVPLLVEQGLRLLHRSRAGSINFALSFGASRNDPFVLSPSFVVFLR